MTPPPIAPAIPPDSAVPRPRPDNGAQATGFAALLDGPPAPALPASSLPASLPPASAPAVQAGAAQAGAGLARAGASGAQLLETKVRLAAGLRQLEAEAKAAAAAAEQTGGPPAAEAVVTGAARALGALLGAADAAAGTNTVALLRQAADATDQPEATGPADHPAAGTDPAAQIEALFGWLFQTLGLVRAAPAAPALAQAGSDPALAAEGATGQGRRPGAGAAAPQTDPSLARLLEAAAAAGAEAGAGSQQGGAARAGAQAGMQAGVQAGVQAGAAAGHARPDGPIGSAAALMLARGAGGQGAGGQGAAGPGAGPAAAQAPGHARPEAQKAPDFFGLLPAGLTQGATPPAGPLATAGGAPPAGAAPGTAPQPGDGPPARLAGFVAGQILGARLDGEGMRIALKPRGLGEVQLEMQRDDSGRLQVVVRAENPMVLAALKGDQDHLAALLSRTGAPAAGLSFDFQDLGGQDRSRQQPPARPRGVAAEAAAGAADEDGETAGWRQTIGRGRLDIRT